MNTSQNGWSPLSDLDNFDDQWLHMFSPSCHLGSDEILDECASDASNEPVVEPPAQQQVLSLVPSFDLLHAHGKSSSTSREKVGPASVDQVLRIAGGRVVEFSNGRAGAPSMLNIPMDPSLSHLSEEDVKNVELVEYLLAAAERVGDQQFDHAASLLNLCGSLTSKSGNAVQRLGYCFAEALRDRMSCGTGNKPLEEAREKAAAVMHENLVTTSESAIKSMQRGQMPMYQIPHLAAVQAILENVTSSNKIHVIDLKIGSGQQWVALMQGLLTSRSDRGPVDLLRITAVGMTAFDRSQVEGTGDRLASFAGSINIPFRFDVVVVADEQEASDFQPDRFQLEPDEESMVVYSECVLKTLIGQPLRIERVMRALKRMNPRVMVVVEVEANLNSPNFGGRFVEALFHCGAIFENLDSSMKRDDTFRARIETGLLGHQVSNILASEGEERYVRGVKIGVWRKFFARFGMVEVEPSSMTMHQAKWFLNRFVKNQSYSVEMDGKSLVLGFNGTPMRCVSTWKFVRLGRLVRDNEELRVEFY